MKSVPGIANGATYSASAGDEGRFVLGARVTPGHFKQTHEHPELRGCTLVESLHQHGLDGFEGTVIAVTHGRWFARRFNRFLVVSEDGVVTDQPSPVYGG